MKAVEVYMRSGRVIFLLGSYEQIRKDSESRDRFEGDAMEDAYGDVPPQPILIYTQHIEFIGPEFDIPVRSEDPQQEQLTPPTAHSGVTEVGRSPDGSPWLM